MMDGWCNPILSRPSPIRTASRSTTQLPNRLRQVITADTATTVRRIMRTVITEGGTGTRAEVDGYGVCGKTGTAQKLEKDGSYANDRYIASFLGLVPTDRPALAILVVVDEPQGHQCGRHRGGTGLCPDCQRGIGLLEHCSGQNLAGTPGCRRSQGQRMKLIGIVHIGGSDDRRDPLPGPGRRSRWRAMGQGDQRCLLPLPGCGCRWVVRRHPGVSRRWT